MVHSSLFVIYLKSIKHKLTTQLTHRDIYMEAQFLLKTIPAHFHSSSHRKNILPKRLLHTPPPAEVINRRTIIGNNAGKSPSFLFQRPFRFTKIYISDNPSPPPLTKMVLGVEIESMKKIVPLGLMFFCILFNYTILRDTKDVLVVTANGSSAEIIPFLRTWVNLPMAIGFMFIYSKLSNELPKSTLFYACMSPFIIFFGAFAFFLYPNTDTLHPFGLTDRLLTVLGPKFLGPIVVLRIWSFCLFYVMAELWGTVVVSLLFWSFANQVCLNLNL